MKPGRFVIVMMGIALLFPLAATGRQGPEELTKEKILAAGQEWQDKYDKFQPPADMVEAMKAKFGGDMRIDVYLGLWCPDSRNNVPPFLKLLDRLGTSVPVRYFGVPRKASRDVKYYVEEFNVEKVPSFVFYRDGKEIGRIIENPKTGLVEDIFDIVFK
jgi:predicted small lipoprotein YifL